MGGLTGLRTLKGDLKCLIAARAKETRTNLGIAKVRLFSSVVHRLPPTKRVLMIVGHLFIRLLNLAIPNSGVLIFCRFVETGLQRQNDLVFWGTEFFPFVQLGVLVPSPKAKEV